MWLHASRLVHESNLLVGPGLQFYRSSASLSNDHRNGHSGFTLAALLALLAVGRSLPTDHALLLVALDALSATRRPGRRRPRAASGHRLGLGPVLARAARSCLGDLTTAALRPRLKNRTQNKTKMISIHWISLAVLKYNYVMAIISVLLICAQCKILKLNEILRYSCEIFVISRRCLRYSSVRCHVK